jgi:hypothetical protein
MTYFDSYPRLGTGYGWSSETFPVSCPAPGVTAEIDREKLLSMIEDGIEHWKTQCDEANKEVAENNEKLKEIEAARTKQIETLADELAALVRTRKHRILFWTWTEVYTVTREFALSEAQRKVPAGPYPTFKTYPCFDNHARLLEIQKAVVNESVQHIRLPETDLRLLNIQ